MMEPRSKNPRKNHEKERDLDCLSNLPDSILTLILSFLDFDSVVRTSILSSRYKHLWSISQSLDFKFQKSKWYDIIKDPIRFSTAFEDYVNNVLQLREHTDLVNFRLSLHRNVSLEFVHNCLSYAVEHKVQHLKVRGIFQTPLTLPGLLLSLPSLTTLSLHNAIVNGIELPKSVSLPSLKSLRLKKFEFSYRSYNVGMFLGCPNLETLVLTKCSIKPVDDLKALHVNCLNLKNLEIRRWRSPWRCFDEHVIDLNAPNLALLKFEGSLVRLHCIDVSPHVERACFDLCFPTACVMVDGNERKQKISECLLNMLVNLCGHVRVLSLSLNTIEILSSIFDLHPYTPLVLENLRIIKFTAENKFSEMTVPIKTVSRLMDNTGTEVLIYNGYKVKKVLLEEAKAKSKTNGNIVYIPAYFMQFLLESSPAAEYLSIEFPNVCFL